MKKLLSVLLMLASHGALAADGWLSRQLHSTFYAEGSAVGDIDGDGRADLVSGPWWYRGPEFKEQSALYEPKEFPVANYSDNFFGHVQDLNGDGLNDVLVLGFPGKEARLYVNPGKPELTKHWPVHIVADQVGNESPTFVDLIPGGLPELVCSRNSAYGFYTPGKDVTQPWKWHAISENVRSYQRFSHGLGVGDLNGDGRPDVIDKMSWWEQPAKGAKTAKWKQHRWVTVPYQGGAQILVDDVDGDGDADIITSLEAHRHGVAWFEQVQAGSFAKHLIVGHSSTENPHGVAFSQPHGLALADIDGDGVNDFVTGKRWFAHNGKDPGAFQPAVLYWFRNSRTKDGVEFVPHLVDDNSGVGVGVTVADLNGDGKSDIVSANKKGLSIHLQTANVTSGAVQKWKPKGGISQDDYGSGLTAEEALKRMDAPEGFAVDMIAREPDIAQPIAMCFDARGRIWILEGHTYPTRAPEGQGKDRIVILEDADGDGSFESKKVFVEGINLGSGMEVGFGGVWVGAAPYLLFYPDADGDDQPDAQPQIVLDGWGYQDTHETLNAFTWGPDGWLYGCHGVFTHSNVGKPGTPDEQRQKLNGAVWRVHPVSHEFQVYAHGTSNPWGVDFNAKGDFFISACVIPHFYHVVQGGRYIRQARRHFNPYTFGEIDTIADHQHYAGSIRDHAFWGDNKAKRPFAPTDTSALGGGHAHCGLAIYQADVFPAAYRGEAFFHNLHGHRILREKLESDGSGYTARHRPDFLFANDHDFIGVGVMQGPDGAMYYSDWVDPQTCHHRDDKIWDRSNGRIYRVRYGKARGVKMDLRKESGEQLVKRLGDANAFIARQAQLVLHERAAANSLKRESVAAALANFEKQHAGNSDLRLRAFWTRHVTGLLTGELVMAALADADEHIRGWAVQVAFPNAGTMPRFVEMAHTDSSQVVRRYLASKLQTILPEHRWDIAEGLVSHAQSEHDRNIPLLAWYGIEPLVELDTERAMKLANRSGWKQLVEFVSRRATATPAGRVRLLASLAQSETAKDFIERGNQLLTALANMPPVERPAGWKEARARGERFQQNARVNAIMSELGVRFGDADFFDEWRALAKKRGPAVPERAKALELLQIGGDPQLGDLARSIIDHKLMRKHVIAALRSDPGPATAEVLVSRLSDFGKIQRNDAINLLASRADMALVLLKAVEKKEISASIISPVLLDQFDAFGNRDISDLIKRNWSRGGGEVNIAELKKKIEEWEKKLNPVVMAKADVSRGRQMYGLVCGNCHKLFGEGIALGPDLTGSNRGDLHYVLENVLAPSAVVGKDYLVQVFTLKDESVVSGMVREENADFAKVALPGGAAVDVKLADVVKRETKSMSLMPSGLFEAMTLEMVADLVKYLASPTQVPMPGEAPAKPAPKPAPKPAKGASLIIEGESLLRSAKANGGNVIVQPMKRFGSQWSGGSQLFWRAGKPGNVFTIQLDQVPTGTVDLTLHPTTANDYATVRVTVDGKQQTADFHAKKVGLGEPITFTGVSVRPKEPLRVDIHITGRNKSGIPGRHFVGIDRFEINLAGQAGGSKKKLRR